MHCTTGLAVHNDFTKADMKVSKETKDRIAHIKSEVSQQKHDLMIYLARLQEHPGTKRVCKGLEQVIGRLEEWQRS